MAFQFRHWRWPYAQVPTNDAISPVSPSAKSLPSFSEVLASKRLRWASCAGVALFLLSLVFRHSEQIAAMRHSLSSPSQHDASPVAEPAAGQTEVEWSRFAYVQYVTNTEYLCNSVMFFERLDHLQSKADRVMMYPSKMLDPLATEGDTYDAKLLIRARDVYGVKLAPITVQHRPNVDRELPPRIVTRDSGP